MACQRLVIAPRKENCTTSHHKMLKHHSEEGETPNQRKQKQKCLHKYPWQKQYSSSCSDATDRQMQTAANKLRTAESVTTRSQTTAAEKKAQTKPTNISIPKRINMDLYHGSTHISTVTKEAIISLLENWTSKQSIARLTKTQERAVAFINKTE